jgi:hypothetical protein
MLNMVEYYVSISVVRDVVLQLFKIVLAEKDMANDKDGFTDFTKSVAKSALQKLLPYYEPDRESKKFEDRILKEIYDAEINPDHVISLDERLTKLREVLSAIPDEDLDNLFEVAKLFVGIFFYIANQEPNNIFLFDSVRDKVKRLVESESEYKFPLLVDIGDLFIVSLVKGKQAVLNDKNIALLLDYKLIASKEKHYKFIIHYLKNEPAYLDFYQLKQVYKEIEDCLGKLNERFDSKATIKCLCYLQYAKTTAEKLDKEKYDSLLEKVEKTLGPLDPYVTMAVLSDKLLAPFLFVCNEDVLIPTFRRIKNEQLTFTNELLESNLRSLFGSGELRLE